MLEIVEDRYGRGATLITSQIPADRWHGLIGEPTLAGLATITDPELMNPWGVSHSATSRFWTSNQGKGTATIHDVTGPTNVSKVNINPPAGDVLVTQLDPEDPPAKSTTATPRPSWWGAAGTA